VNTTKRARYIYLKGWIVEERKEADQGKMVWARSHQGLAKHEAYWVAYGVNV